jgi:plasmid stability protein
MIRNIDAAVIEAWRRRAAVCGTSMEEQARRALTKAVGMDREAAARRLTEIRRMIGRLEGPYSMTSSAWARIDGGAVRPSALAVLMLMTSSNLVARSMGRSAGLAPFKILST